MSQFDQVSVVKQANVYFDGKCVSHTVVLTDGSRKTLGVILPSTLALHDRRAGSHGRRRRQLPRAPRDESQWTTYAAGESFSVPADSSFEIACDDPYHYVCHFG
jgi:uncharacterized protein YaiE (UPF0345 family)